MSVLMEFSMFPLEGEGSKSAYVSRIIEMIHRSGYSYKLTPMSTIVETKNLHEALKLVEDAYAQIDECERVYACLKFDIRDNRDNGMEQKIASVENHLGHKVTH